jgi:hypothetical protein
MELSLMFSNLLSKIEDKYITWRTGKDKSQREWEAWYEQNVVYRASTIDNMFMNFKHVIEVDVGKFTDPCEPFTWVPCKDARQYFWPARKLGENAVWRFERVYWNEWEKRWHINDMGDADKIFVATNNDRDAMMIALKYMS